MKNIDVVTKYHKIREVGDCLTQIDYLISINENSNVNT